MDFQQKGKEVYRDMEQWTEIRQRVLKDGVSKRQIMRETGMHWDTLKKILEHSSPPEHRRSKFPKKPKIGPYIDRIQQILEHDKLVHKKQRHTAKRIWEVLQDEGFTGGYTIVKDAVRELRRTMKEVYMPLIHRPGEAQVDFGHALVKMSGVLRKICFFVMTLPYSDAFFIRAYERECTETFWDGHVRAFEFFGGVPRRITYDNIKIAISKITGPRLRELTRGFLQLISHYLFDYHFCLVRRANEKGVVEGTVKYSRLNFMVPVPQVRDFDELNALLLQRCRDDMQRRVRGQVQTKDKLLLDEQLSFLPLPFSPFEACRTQPGWVNTELNVPIGFNTYSARDSMRNWRFDTEASYRHSDSTTWSLGAGYSNFESGSNEYIGYYPQSDDMGSLTRTFTRIDHAFDDGSTAYLQWYGNFLVRHFPIAIDRYTTNENHLEGQLNFNVAEKHSFSVGGNLSWFQIGTTSSGNSNETVYNREPYSERSGGLFLIDRFEVTKRLAMEGQIRGDFHSENEDDWSTRISAIYSLDDTKNHNLRFSFARAFRIPTVAIRDTTKTSLFGLSITLPPQDRMQNENIYSLEAGYTGKFTKELTFSVNSYYQRIEHIIGYSNVIAGPVTTSTFCNVDGATAYGAECEIALQNRKGKLSTWYAYNGLTTDQYGEAIRALWPAKYKAGVTGRLFLPDDWTFNTNYVFNDDVLSYGATPFDADAFNRLDLTIAKKIASGRGELMLGVSDVLNKTNKVALDIGEFTGHETPGRAFFARMQLKF